MKKILKIVPCCLIVLVIVSLTCVQAFALNSYTAPSGEVAYNALNEPDRVIFAGNGDYRSLVELSEKVNKLTDLHSVEIAVDSNYVNSKASLHTLNGMLQGSAQDNRSVRCDGYHAWNIFGQSHLAGATVNPSTSYTSFPGSGNVLTDSGLYPSTTDNQSAVRELGTFQFSKVRYEFYDYYVDSKINSNLNNTAYLAHVAYVAVPTSLTVNDSAYNTILAQFRSRPFAISLVYYDVNGRIQTYSFNVSPSVKSRGFVTWGSQRYLIVESVCNYESAIYERYSSLNAYKASNGLTELPNVRIEASSPPANVGGVGGQGVSPYYNVGGFSFVGADYRLYNTIPDPTPDLPSETSSVITWITDVVGGFLNIEFFGFIRLGDILGVVVAVGLVMFLLKMFAGG